MTRKYIINNAPQTPLDEKLNGRRFKHHPQCGKSDLIPWGVWGCKCPQLFRKSTNRGIEREELKDHPFVRSIRYNSMYNPKVTIRYYYEIPKVDKIPFPKTPKEIFKFFKDLWESMKLFWELTSKKALTHTPDSDRV